MTQNLAQSDDYIPPELIDLPQPITQKQFLQLCRKYRKLRLELTSTGDLIIMPFNGLLSSRRNVNLTSQLAQWSIEDGSGICFGSSTIFGLPNGAWRMPDVAWIKREKWDNLTEQEKDSFTPFCPDFVVEICSPSDDLKELYLKMAEYVLNGVSLGWLIDPFKQQVHVYRPDQEPVVLGNPKTVSGNHLMPGFELRPAEIWSV